MHITAEKNRGTEEWIDVQIDGIWEKQLCAGDGVGVLNEVGVAIRTHGHNKIEDFINIFVSFGTPMHID